MFALTSPKELFLRRLPYVGLCIPLRVSGLNQGEIMGIQITLPKAVEMVQAAIARKGADYVYPNHGTQCQYVDWTVTQDENGTPERHFTHGCIIGDIFINELNLDMEGIADGYMNSASSSAFIQELARCGLVESCTDEADDYFSYVQSAQDRGMTWGNAHTYALDAVSW